MTAIRGKLAETTLAQVLSRVLSAGRSGGLRMHRGSVSRQFFIDGGGVIRYAASSQLAESLTEHLKRQGRFEPEAMRKATSGKQGNELLTSALLRLGFLAPEEHRALVREMIEAVLLAAARATDADYEYQEGEIPFVQPGDAGVPLPVAILGLARHASDLGLLRRTLGSGQLRIRLNPAPPLPLDRIPLGPAEGFLVSRADGTLSVREIALMSPLDPEETDRALCGMILCGVLRLDGSEPETATGTPPAVVGTDAPAPSPVPVRTRPQPERPRAAPAGPVDEMLQRFASLEGQNFYQVLGISPAAAANEVRQAYYSLARRLHPDKFTEEETKGRAEKLFAAITEAYATLSRPENRKEYDQALAPVQSHPAADSSPTDLARQNFLRGRALFDRNEVVKALPFFEHAVEQDPAREEYVRFLALVQSRNPRMRREAEMNFLKAIELNPTLAENYAQLAILYRKIGQEELAEQYLHKALSWDPTNATALEASGGEEHARKGLLKGLFGKS